MTPLAIFINCGRKIQMGLESPLSDRNRSLGGLLVKLPVPNDSEWRLGNLRQTSLLRVAPVDHGMCVYGMNDQPIIRIKIGARDASNVAPRPSLKHFDFGPRRSRKCVGVTPGERLG
jgi:hypothetical protein